MRQLKKLNKDKESLFKDYIKKYDVKYDNQESIIKLIEHFDSYNNLPKLHRWCNTTSPIYKDSCNLEKKIDNANRDNCYSNIR